MANKSNFTAFSYLGCVVNGVKFIVEKRDAKRKTQNSGVFVPSQDGLNFYGVLEEILELSYLKKDCSVLLFKCKWFDIDLKKKRIQEDSIFISVYVVVEW